MITFPIMYYALQVSYCIVLAIAYQLALKKGWIKRDSAVGSLDDGLDKAGKDNESYQNGDDEKHNEYENGDEKKHHEYENGEEKKNHIDQNGDDYTVKNGDGQYNSAFENGETEISAF